MADFMRVADQSWPILNQLMRGHAALYRATGGRLGGRVPGLPPMLLLHHEGARSGKRRTAPLVYIPHGDGFTVAPAKGGHPQNPAWFHNLRAHPEVEVQLGSKRIPVRAREANAEERRRLWPKAVEHNQFWGEYQKRTER